MFLIIFKFFLKKFNRIKQKNIFITTFNNFNNFQFILKILNVISKYRQVIIHIFFSSNRKKFKNETHVD